MRSEEEKHRNMLTFHFSNETLLSSPLGKIYIGKHTKS